MPPTTPANDRRRRGIWAIALFGLFLLINARLVTSLLRLQGWRDGEGAPSDPTMLAALSLSIAFAAVSASGLVGAWRGWSWKLLVPAGLLSVAWPSFVVLVILSFPKC
jgi:hypothetical protein